MSNCWKARQKLFVNLNGVVVLITRMMKLSGQNCDRDDDDAVMEKTGGRPLPTTSFWSFKAWIKIWSCSNQASSWKIDNELVYNHSYTTIVDNWSMHPTIHVDQKVSTIISNKYEQPPPSQNYQFNSFATISAKPARTQQRSFSSETAWVSVHPSRFGLGNPITVMFTVWPRPMTCFAQVTRTVVTDFENDASHGICWSRAAMAVKEECLLFK